MASYEAVYRREKGDADPSRTVPLNATERQAAEEEARAGMREDEKMVDVEEADEGGDFTVDHSELGGPDRLT